jgi:predicted Holliday junction resolvase-like endonuclease
MQVNANLREDAMRDLALGVVIGFLLAWVYAILWKVRYSAALRSDAVVRSQAITAGKVHEQLLPYFPDFPYNPKDVRFLGSPTDLIVFDGLADGEVRRVVFLEVKTGGSCLTERERSVRDAIQAGDVEWLEVRVTRPLAESAGRVS